MKELTRRKVLMLAGAAGMAPLAAVAHGNRSGDPETKDKKCKLVFPDKDPDTQLAIWNSVHNKLHKKGFNESVVIKFQLVHEEGEKNNFYVGMFPWAPHQGIKCPKALILDDSKPLTFTFEMAKLAEGKNKLHTHTHVKISCTFPKRPTHCCFMCGDIEVCVQPGHAFLCNGIEYFCPES
jgi:hypothetical protein